MNSVAFRSLAAALGFVLLVLVSYPRLAISAEFSLPRAPKVTPLTKDIALTFDDGPNGRATRDIVDILVKYHVPAMFFSVGRSIAADPETTRYVADHGFPVENHTWDHSFDIPKFAPTEVTQELVTTQDEIKLVTGTTPTYFRWPHGLHNKMDDAIARGLKLHPIYWSIDPQDYNTGDPILLTRRVLAGARQGRIVDLHDGLQDGIHAVELRDRKGLITALPMIITQLRDEGYVFRSVPYLISLKHGYEY